jgi:hypothetical protein
MAIVDRSTLYNWFKRGDKPLASQFADWIDSYWHKWELIPGNRIEGLQEALDAKTNETDFEAHINDTDNPHEVNPGQIGAATSEEMSDLQTIVAALNGAFVYRGNIANTNAAVAANHSLLTARLTALLGRVPRLGDVLKDTDEVEWYCTGEQSSPGVYVWNEYGQSKINPVTQFINGLMLAIDKVKLDGIEAEANKYIHPTATAFVSGLYKITVNNLGHVTAATAVVKADITALGIPGQDTDTVYTHPSATAYTSGLYKITVNSLGHVTAATAVVKADITALGISDAGYTHPTATAYASGLYKITVNILGHVTAA